MSGIRSARIVFGAGLLLAAPADRALGVTSGPFAGLASSPDSVSQSGYGGNCTLCHDFNRGPGSVAILGVPDNYQPDAIYDIIVRISDPDQFSAGFQLSVENGPVTAPAHQGTLIDNSPFTKWASNDPNFITHTSAGVQNATTNWDANGSAALYSFQWQAPSEDIGLIRFFATGNAINTNGDYFGDRVYTATKTTRSFPSGPGDADRDGDVDLADHDVFFTCWSGPEIIAPGGCELYDADVDFDVDLLDYAFWQDIFTGPIPVEYTNADATRGGKLYDQWWTVIAEPPPAGNHPLYPPAGTQSGPDTFRCQECHGWDYKGAGGQYASGPHYTGIGGVFGTARRPQEIFDLLGFDPNTTTNGHDMAAYGVATQDLWDVTRFILTELLDTDAYIDSGGVFIGNGEEGGNTFLSHCNGCHGDDGTAINFGTPQDPVYVGTIAVQNPWKFLHKVRFGHPGAPMLSLVDLFTPTQSAADLGAYAQQNLP